MKVPAFERKMLNMMIGFPSNGEVSAKFAIALTNLFGYYMANPVPGFRNQKIMPMHVQGSILSRSRMKLVQEALRQDCTHLLFIDSDQTFPKDTAHRLLAWQKKIVACNIPTKQLPAHPTARMKHESRPDGLPIYSNPGDESLTEVWRVGTGVMLVDMEVFRKLGAKVFDIKWVPELQDYQGEDWSFCEAAQAAGYKIYIDHGLSQQVGHVGLLEFVHDYVVDSIQVKQVPETAVERA